MIELEDISGRVRPATPEGLALARIVLRFLRTGEARDVDAMEALAAPGFTARFPGDVVHESVRDWMATSRGRFQFVRKQFEAFDVVVLGGEGAGVVHAHGRLDGAFADGVRFDGTRFIDRFEIAGGLIVRQDVWNDLAVRFR